MQQERVPLLYTEMQHDATPHIEVPIRRGADVLYIYNTGNVFGNVLYTGQLEMQHIYASPLLARIERVALEIQHRTTTSPAA